MSEFPSSLQYWNRGRNGAEHEWYNDILKHVLTSNHDLTSLEISTNERAGYNIRSTAFLEGILCPNVKYLAYEKGREDTTSILMEAFVKMFPNLKALKLKASSVEPIQDFTLISQWTKLEALDVMTNDERLSEIQVNSPNFRKLVIGPLRSHVFSYVNFLCRHSKIRHLSSIMFIISI